MIYNVFNLVRIWLYSIHYLWRRIPLAVKQLAGLSNTRYKQRRRLPVIVSVYPKVFWSRGSTSMTKFSRWILYIYTFIYFIIITLSKEYGDFAVATILLGVLCPRKTVVRRMYTYDRCPSDPTEKLFRPYLVFTVVLSTCLFVSTFHMCIYVYILYKCVYCVYLTYVCRYIYLPLSAIETRMPFVPGSYTAYSSHLKNSRSLLSRKWCISGFKQRWNSYGMRNDRRERISNNLRAHAIADIAIFSSRGPTTRIYLRVILPEIRVIIIPR